MRCFFSEQTLGHIVVFAVASAIFGNARASEQGSPQQFVGTSTCRSCHEGFYTLWATSHHGLAMQPYTDDYSKASLAQHATDVRIDQYSYRAYVAPGEGYVLEKGPDKETKLPIVHILGGKNVCYFLTPYKGGRLQTLPLAYNLNTQSWYDTAASGVRHFPGAERDEAVHWTDPLYTFNTSCFGCHVSQLSTNFDPATDSYHTVWAEPGINCETCHGPADEHVRIFTDAAESGDEPNELHLISTHSMDTEQMNSMCNSCHAKMSVITQSFSPGERFFDHYDLLTLEHPDFYPDGRDLGENYTMTTWRMSECVKPGKLDCMHCHTSSGRFRFEDKPQTSCTPCHQARVDHMQRHSHHPDIPEAPTCVNCHMPMTAFAHMNRSDHSIAPPTPATGKAFKSPVACLQCHKDQSADWADRVVRRWHKHDYQAPYLKHGHWVDSTRNGDWKDLPAILSYIRSDSRDEILTNSLIRLIQFNDSEQVAQALIHLLKTDSSPLIRGSAAAGLQRHLTQSAVQALLKAIQDPYRVVRLRAASTLAPLPIESLPPADQVHLKNAQAELLEGLNTRLDDFSSHFMLGNFYMAKRETSQSIQAFERAIKYRPDYVPAYVNVSMAHNAAGNNTDAEKQLRKALEVDPNNAPVYLNLGMLLGEMNKITEAENSFKAALRLDPNSAIAAYNLGVIAAQNGKIKQAIHWTHKAYKLEPSNTKYGYTAGFYMAQSGQIDQAVTLLKTMLDKGPFAMDAAMLLCDIYVRINRIEDALKLYDRSLKQPNLNQQERMTIEQLKQRVLMQL